VSLAHRLAYRVIQRVRREPVHAVLRRMEESQWWPEDRLREDQWTRLRRVLAAAAHAPDYGGVWRTAGVDTTAIRRLEDLRLLPLLEKTALRRDPDCVRNPSWIGPVNVHVTTGSSGVPLRVLRSRLAGAHGRAAQIRGRSWFGIRLGDR
jgi:phenylacetate-CoA ligase